METSSIERKFLFALLAIVVVITLIILYPFLAVFILAGAFAVFLDPLYKWIKKYITRGGQGFASFITVIIFLIVLCIPVFFIGSVIFNQTQDAYYSIVSNGGADSFIMKIDNSINNILPNGFSFNTHEKITQLFSFFANNIADLFTSTFNTLLMSILTVFAIFYLLKDGRKWKDEIVKISPLSEAHVYQIISSLKDSINRIFKGTFLIAIIQGTLACIGFSIFGVPSPALWGVIAGIASFVPTLGTAIIFIPAILFLLFSGMQLQALGLLIWAALLVGSIDNVLAPYLISKKSEVSPFFMLFAILGGISLMGAIGIIMGPLVLSLLYTLVSIYRKEVKLS
jgi:predicted PurR-regulated permease PerM